MLENNMFNINISFIVHMSFQRIGLFVMFFKVYFYGWGGCHPLGTVSRSASCISRCAWSDLVARQGAAAHSLVNTDLEA